MNTDKTWQIVSTSSERTEALAAKLAQNFKGGEVIELASDLGGGKTTFARGLVRGLGSSDIVSSPTFKICNIYHAPQFTVNHFDFYRLPEAGLIANELADVLDDPHSITIVEWAGLVHHALPTERLSITIEHQSEHTRQLTFRYSPKLQYLMESLS
jgi:tRNA threonylcarbamoyladenosine biosynthesis protein TsaE